MQMAEPVVEPTQSEPAPEGGEAGSATEDDSQAA